MKIGHGGWSHRVRSGRTAATMMQTRSCRRCLRLDPGDFPFQGEIRDMLPRISSKMINFIPVIVDI